MKKIFLTALLILLFASSGWCFTIYGVAETDPHYNDFVGDTVDTWLAETDILHDSSEFSETEWVNDVLYNLGYPETTYQVKEEEDVPYYRTDDDITFAYYLTTPPETEYFLLKNAQWWVLFQNIGEIDWAVFNTTQLPSGMNIPSSDFTISHVTRFGDAAPVPEPSTFLLLGGGLVGLAFYGRKRSKK